ANAIGQPVQKLLQRFAEHGKSEAPAKLRMIERDAELDFGTVFHFQLGDIQHGAAMNTREMPLRLCA
ncbi:hypothetical protein ABXW85_23635, partial [Streptococcus suis]